MWSSALPKKLWYKKYFMANFVIKGSAAFFSKMRSTSSKFYKKTRGLAVLHNCVTKPNHTVFPMYLSKNDSYCKLSIFIRLTIWFVWFAFLFDQAFQKGINKVRLDRLSGATVIYCQTCNWFFLHRLGNRFEWKYNWMQGFYIRLIGINLN